MEEGDRIFLLFLEEKKLFFIDLLKHKLFLPIPLATTAIILDVIY
jgi:hypothetical protein